MAIDTASRRYSMIGFGAPGVELVTPVPDGSITAPDRAHLLGLYPGISIVVVVSDRVLRAVDGSGPRYSGADGSRSRYTGSDGSGPRYRGS